MFVGTHTPKLDDKGRLFLPARFREELAGGLVITKGQDHCLFVYTRAEFLEQAASLRSASVTSKTQRDYARIFFASAFDDVPDRQGRVTVPAKLREYAGLTREVVVVGAFTRLELWDAAAWDAYEAAQEAGFADLDEEVLPR